MTSPYAIWVRDALEEAYEQVRQHSGQAVQRQKRLYDRRAVKRQFAVGDWAMRFNTPAKKCKLDSAWIGPYWIVSFIGWAIGIQKDPESPIVIVHCQDIKKVPPPPGAISWLTTKKLSIAPSVMILGASTMQRTLPSSLSLTVAPPAEGTMIADVESNHSVSSSIDPSDLSRVDVTSAPLISVPLLVESQVVEIMWRSCVIHPFYIHKMDSGPVRLMTIAHAFNYRVAVLRDGVRSAVRVGRSRKVETCFLKDVNISWGQQVTVMFQIVSTLMEEVPAFALRMRELRLMDKVQLMDNPWGHVEDCVAKCNCLESDQTGAYVHCLIPRTGLSESTPWDDTDVSVEIETGFTFNNDCGYLGVGRAGSIPFVSEKPGQLWQVVVSGLCTVEDRAIDIF